MPENIYLKPCEIHMTHSPCIVRTVLGSCISIVMYNLKYNIAGVCHAMLPRVGTVTDSSDVFKYVDSSIYYMVDYFQLEGVPKSEIEVKYFGGADMFSYNASASGTKPDTVGAKNIAVAKETLQSVGLSVVSFDTGGNMGRKLYFYSENGKVFLKKIKPQMAGL